jgi:hypothetical protein
MKVLNISANTLLALPSKDAIEYLEIGEPTMSEVKR